MTDDITFTSIVEHRLINQVFWILPETEVYDAIGRFPIEWADEHYIVSDLEKHAETMVSHLSWWVANTDNIDISRAQDKCREILEHFLKVSIARKKNEERQRASRKRLIAAQGKTIGISNRPVDALNLSATDLNEPYSRFWDFHMSRGDKLASVVGGIVIIAGLLIFAFTGTKPF